MKKSSFFIIITAFIAATNFSSCKKDSSQPQPFVFYSVTVDGATVSFKNESKGAATYKWDFGDGETSTEESPTHTYASKGKYVPTLYATSATGVTGEASTVLHIAKTSAIKMDDHTLSDWDTVTHNVVLAGPNSGNFIKAKYDYDGNYVYVYFEQNTTQADGNIYDLYIDADLDITTGLLTNDIKNGAYDILFEGTVIGDWLDPYYFIGSDQNNFDNYKYQNINEFFKVGTIEQDGSVQKFEFAISRSKIKGLTGKGLKIGVQAAANDWSAEIGFSPDLGSDAFYLDMSE
ncbi:MAG: PKD domain-containing protein [Parafilimonas sp.]|nr:PKD domain-containing protein [Parafilimonas sp.]